MVGLVVQHHDAGLVAHIAENPAAEGGVTLGAPAKDAAARIGLLGEGVPVGDHDADLTEQSFQVAWDQAEAAVRTRRCGGNQPVVVGESLLHGEVRTDHEGTLLRSSPRREVAGTYVGG